MLTFEESFYQCAAWYNGYTEDFDKLLDYLMHERNSNSADNIHRPDSIKSDGSTPIMELYWMILVQQWGNYGTSPRSGWIDRNTLDDCIVHLKNIRDSTYKEIW